MILLAPSSLPGPRVLIFAPDRIIYREKKKKKQQASLHKTDRKTGKLYLLFWCLSPFWLL